MAPIRILIAEDNPMNYELLDALLGSLGHEAEWARDGAEALTLAQSGGFDLMLLDLHMPRLNGLDVMLGLRATPPPTPLKVIVLTADALLGVRAEMFAAGVDGYLCKPLDIAALMREMESVMYPTPIAC